MGIAENVVSCLGKMIKFWRVELNCGSEALTEVPMKRGIFQRCVIAIAVCNCPNTSDKHTEDS